MAYITTSLSAGKSGNGTFAYQQFPGGWAITQITQNTTVASLQSSQTTQFANVQWYDSQTGDSRRASKAVAPPTAPPLSPPNISPVPLPGASSGSGTITVENLGTGQSNLLYQHGIFGDASTWARMDPWIQMDFPLAAVAKTSLNSTDYLTNQANNLISLAGGTGKTKFLGVGYSNGGLVTRDAAYRGPTGLINRVITLDATNNGAEMTLVSRGALAGAMTAFAQAMVAWGNGTPLSQPVSSLGTLLWVNVPI